MQPIDTTRAHCVDPETLAAWVDGGLAAPAAAEVETHLSTCARCQAVLAALSETDVDATTVAPPTVVLPFWSRRPVKWAAAALAAAASITLWTLNQPERLAMSEPVPDSVLVQAPASAPAELRRGEPTASASAPSELRRISPPPKPTASKPVVVPEVVVAEPPPPAAPPPPPPPQPAPPPVNPATAVTGARADMAFRPMPEMSELRPTFEVISASDQNAPLANVGLVPQGAGRGGGVGAGAASNLAVGLGRRPPVRWRVMAAVVERSVNGGQSWEPVTLDPPFALTSGSAPYQNVCWLVGQDGVVFRTTNGTSFERMTAPDKVHLLVVVAIDALRAMVTAVDGRIFDTTDGGVTWTVRK